MPELEVVHFQTSDDWETWLDANHVNSDGVWLMIAKKKSNQKSPSYAEALEVALCFGWIDSQKRRYDDDFYLQRFTARRKNSKWSQINVHKAETLIEAGKMRQSGLKEVKTAQADGRWDAAYQAQSDKTVPGDLQAALDNNPTAKAFFKTLNSTNRYAIIFRVTTAKKIETRQRRIKKFIKMLANGEKIYA